MPRKPAAKTNTVTAAVERDLADIRKRAPALADSALAATALELARGLDDANSYTSKGMGAKVLVETILQIQALAPPKREKDGIDQLAEHRNRRRSAAASD